MSEYESKCFLSQVVEASALKRKLQLYILEKEKAEAGVASGCVKQHSYDKITGFYKSPRQYNENIKVKKAGLFDTILTEDSIQNFICKSILGFLGGILLTYICFMFLVFSLNFTLNRATYICVGLGIILSLGLAFSVKIRCTVFLCIPQLFSKRGRQALLAYAFILALSGPAKNTLHNVEVMSESLACGQEQIKQAENELLKCVQKPNAVAKKSVEKLLEKINSSVKYFKNFIFQFYRTCFDILETVSHAQKWLYSISFLCNRQMGEPTKRCKNLLHDAIDNCEYANPLPWWKKLCKISPYAVKSICTPNANEKCIDDNKFCSLNDIETNFSVRATKNRLHDFKRRALNIFAVRVDVHQTYTQSNRTNTFHEEYQGMATEIRQKTDQFLQYFDFMSVIFGIFILVLFVKVIIYRHKFLTEDHYDNRFITPDFEDIDNTRAEFRMETILPLKPRERTKYIKVTSIRLVPCEKVRLVSSFIFLIFATFKIIIHMLTDSSLYWILSSVRRDEKLLYMSTLKEEETGIVIRVLGNSMVADLFRNVTDAVQRQYSTPRMDPTPCLPDPVPPDWNRYYQISLVVICWLLALFEPYGLRLRHSVMVTYHPDRARERAIWLYNRIISHRNSFVKIARREIRRKYKNASEEPFFRFQFMRKKYLPKCLLCKVKVTKGDNHVTCKTAQCVGVFCEDCYSNLKFCTICTDPAEYGDFSDLSEEKDSSDDEKTCKCRKKKIHSIVKPEIVAADTEPLKVKMPHIHFDAFQKERARPIPSGPLRKAFKFFRGKVSKGKNNVSLSDIESSDWEEDECAASESFREKSEDADTSSKEERADVMETNESKEEVRRFQNDVPDRDRDHFGDKFTDKVQKFGDEVHEKLPHKLRDLRDKISDRFNDGVRHKFGEKSPEKFRDEVHEKLADVRGKLTDKFVDLRSKFDGAVHHKFSDKSPDNDTEEFRQKLGHVRDKFNDKLHRKFPKEFRDDLHEKLADVGGKIGGKIHQNSPKGKVHFNTAETEKFNDQNFHNKMAVRLFRKISDAKDSVPQKVKQNLDELMQKGRPHPDFRFKKIQKDEDEELKDSPVHAEGSGHPPNLDEAKADEAEVQVKSNEREGEGASKVEDQIDESDTSNNKESRTVHVKYAILKMNRSGGPSDGASDRASRSAVTVRSATSEPDDIFAEQVERGGIEAEAEDNLPNLDVKIRKKSNLKTGDPLKKWSPSERATLKQARICFTKDSSSGTVSDPRDERITLCLRKESPASAESDDLSHSRTRCSTDEKSGSRDGLYVKRTSGNINLNRLEKTSKYSEYYSVETDSSDEKFMTVKPNLQVQPLQLGIRNKRGRRISSKNHGLDVEPPQKASRFRKDRTKSSADEEPKEEGNKKKSNKLSWAPDLLSDLPASSKKEGPAAYPSQD